MHLVPPPIDAEHDDPVDPRDPGLYESGLRAARDELRAARIRSYRRSLLPADDERASVGDA